MREAIAELKLDGKNGTKLGYGHDIVVDEDETSDSSGKNDIWDIFSEQDEDKDDSDLVDGVDGVDEPIIDGELPDDGSSEWLKSKCAELAARHDGFNAVELQDQISTLLASNMQGT